MSKKSCFFIFSFFSTFLFFFLCLSNLVSSPTHAQEKPTAIFYVGSQQNIGYPFSVDGSDSHSAGSSQFFLNKDEIINFSWDFGDGTVESGEYLNTHTHQYNSPGTYIINLTVVDKNGLTDSTSATVNVGNLPKVTVSGNTTSAINSAVSSLNGQPGIVSIPAGNYSYNETINTRAGVIFEGAGSSQTRIYTTSKSDKLFIVTGSNARFTGLNMQGYSTSSFATDNHSMALEFWSDVKNIYIDHCEWSAFEISLSIKYYSTATIEYNYIHHNATDDMGYGVMLGAEGYAMIRHNEFSNNRHAIAAGGCPDEACPTRYDSIYNYFHGKEDVNQQACDVDMHQGGHGRMRIYYNTFEDMPNAIGFRDAFNTQIKGNQFHNVDPEDAGGVYWEWIKSQAIIYTWKEDPSYSGPGLDGVYISDNTFDEDCGRHYKIGWGTNIYINCREMNAGDVGYITWNDCDIPSPSTSPSPSPNTCPADLTGDNLVNQDDLKQVLLQIFKPCPDCKENLNSDNLINSLDLGFVIKDWGSCK